MRHFPLATLAGLIATLAVAVPSASGAQVVEEIDFEASDGVILHATLSGEGPLVPRPLIVEYSPYGQGPGGPPVGPRFNYIQVHARGTGASGGSWDIMGPREQLDIKESLQFFCDHPMSTGRIGIYGFSASAIAAYNAMQDTNLPCVEAAGLMAGTQSLYRDLIFIGGMPNLVPATVVSTAIASAFLANLPGRLGDDPQTVGETPAGGLGSVLNAINAFLLHPTEDEFWRERIFPSPDGPPDIPILAVTGFYDVESRGPFQTYQAAKGKGAHLLVVGAHDGPAGGSGGPFPEFERWFAHYLLDEDNGIESEPRVQAYVGHGSHANLRAGQWTKVDATDWPIPGTRWRGLHLDAATSGSATSLNDGSLSLERPAQAVTQSELTVPSNTLQTDPYTAATVTNVMQSNLTELLSLTYTTPALTQPVMAVGPATLKVRLSSTAPETDIVAVLSDVAPDGASNPVAAGRLRSSFPEIDESRSLKDPVTGEIVQPYGDFAAKQNVPIGSARDYNVEFWPIGNRFETGHRLRLTLAGTPVTFLPTVPALNSIQVGGPNGAALQLPTLPGTDLCSAMGAEPCLTTEPEPEPAARCLNRRAWIGGHRQRRTGIAKIRVGTSRSDLDERRIQPVNRTRRVNTYCVRGTDKAVAAVFAGSAPTAKVSLLTTTAPRHRAGKVGPGMDAGAIRRRFPRSKPIPPRLIQVSEQAVFGVRNELVEFLAVAKPALIAKRPKLRRQLRRAGFR